MATIRGTSRADALRGTGAADVIEGLGGNDTLDGLGGSDILRGGQNRDTLRGGGGDDLLDGGLDSDLVDGGAGVDTVTAADSAVGVAIRLSEGTLRGNGTDRLVSVENADGSAFGDLVRGDDGANRLRGLDGDDILDGLDGNDVLEGGDGDDDLYVGGGVNRADGGAGRDLVGFQFSDDGSGGGFQPVVVDLAAGTYRVAGAVSRLSGIEDAAGSTAADTLRGDGGANRLSGGEGDDKIFGLDGNDLLFGSEGDDLMDGGAGDDEIIATDGRGQIKGGSGDDTLLSGFYNSQVSGGSGADRFGTGGSIIPSPDEPLFTILDFSHSQGDVIDLRDYAIVFDGMDTVAPIRFIGEAGFGPGDGPELRYENPAGGGTLIEFYGANGRADGLYTIRLDSAVELQAGDFLLGTPGSRQPTEGDDFLQGGAGPDTIKSLGGRDQVYGGGGNDDLNGGNGDDFVSGEDGDDFVFGGPGNDFLSGGDGADKLGGGQGVDTLDGGAGPDRFDFERGYSGAGATRDELLDFEDGDIINLAQVDANAGASGDQAFTFVGTGALSGAGQLRSAVVGSVTLVQGSTDADAAPEFEIAIRQRVVLAADDFTL